MKIVKKIKVDFFFQWAPGWTNYESIFLEMTNSNKFDNEIILLPFHHSGMHDENNSEARDFLIEKNYHFIWHEDYDFEKRKPDVVFIQNPYDNTRPERFSCANLNKIGIKFAYVPYGLDVGGGDRNLTFQYNMTCHNLAKWIFVRSNNHKKFYGMYCQAGNNHVYVTGHPKFDNYNTRYKIDKSNSSERKTLLWTPHFVEGNIKGWSTFNFYYSTMIFMAMNYNINIIVRPHPLFIGRVKVFGGEVIDNFKNLILHMEKLKNISFDFSASYADSFSQSDALMADAGSFLLEYLPTKKPILFLTNEQCLGLNKSAEFIYQDYYVARSSDDINNFINMVISEQDEKKEKRFQLLEKEIYLSPNGAGHEITKIISSYFKYQKEVI